MLAVNDNDALEARLFSCGIVRIKALFTHARNSNSIKNALFPTHAPLASNTSESVKPLKLCETRRAERIADSTKPKRQFILPTSKPKPFRRSFQQHKILHSRPVSRVYIEEDSRCSLLEHRRLDAQSRRRKHSGASETHVAPYKSRETAALRLRRLRTGSVQLNQSDLSLLTKFFADPKANISPGKVRGRRGSVGGGSFTVALHSPQKEPAFSPCAPGFRSTRRSSLGVTLSLPSSTTNALS